MKEKILSLWLKWQPDLRPKSLALLQSSACFQENSFSVFSSEKFCFMFGSLKKILLSVPLFFLPKENKNPLFAITSLLLLHQFSAVEDPRQMHIYLTENSVTPLTTWSHNFLHYSAIIFSSLINGPSPNFQHISLRIFSHEKSFHSQTQFSCVHHKIQFSRIHLLHETTFKEFSVCNHIFRDSSMEIYKFKAIISIKPL